MNKKKTKPAKPYKDFPLFPHVAGKGYWAKKIRGRLYYFGTWDEGWEVSLKRYETARESLYLGYDLPSLGLSVLEGGKLFLTAKNQSLESGQITQKTFNEYEETAYLVAETLGTSRSVESLVPADFQRLHAVMSKRFGVYRLQNMVTRVKSIFKFLFESGHIEKPVVYGPMFRPPSARALRLQSSKISRQYKPAEVHQLIATANPQLAAMVWLGINAGLGNTDCGSLECRQLDLKGAWLNYPRPKTGIDRRAKLWPETVSAIRRLESQQCPADDDLVFVTAFDNGWSEDAVTLEFRKLAAKAGVLKPGRGFYSLRHTFATIASQTGDQVAVDHVMGHVPTGIGATYRHFVADERLERIADSVRKWLGDPVKQV